jgi:RimJ/RimL family protein N-acetyltransferase
MEVRPLEPRDMEACLDLFEAVAAERRWLASEPPLDRREVRARWRSLLATGTGTLLVALEGTRPVGLAALVGLLQPELGVLVAADRRGRGVGAALLEASLAWASAVSAEEVVLHVFTTNTAAIALYLRHGFEERGRLAGACLRASGERWDAIRMVRPMAGRGFARTAAAAAGASPEGTPALSA